MEGSEKEIVTEQLSYDEDNQKWKHTAEEKKLLRKINNTVLPTVFFIIFIQVQLTHNIDKKKKCS
jgi:hypothetical protein